MLEHVQLLVTHTLA